MFGPTDTQARDVQRTPSGCRASISTTYCDDTSRKSPTLAAVPTGQQLRRLNRTLLALEAKPKPGDWLSACQRRRKETPAEASQDKRLSNTESSGGAVGTTVKDVPADTEIKRESSNPHSCAVQFSEPSTFPFASSTLFCRRFGVCLNWLCERGANELVRKPPVSMGTIKTTQR